MPVVFYRCSKCRKEFNSHKAAKSCENSHLIPTSAKAVSYTIKPFPYSIEVTFNNGERRVYNAQDLGG
jgi:hypothetical protein